MNENNIVKIIGIKFICSGDLISFTLPPIPAKIIVGTESKNENFRASSLFIPDARAVVVVIPLRLTPGIIANICAKPIKNESFKDISLKVLTFLPSVSER